jgi:hypothetical protein
MRRGHATAVATLAGGLMLVPVAASADASSATWTSVASQPSPVAVYPTATFDANMGRTLVFGGIDVVGNKDLEANALWAWNGAGWTQLCTAAACSAAQPAGRWAHAMTYDPVAKHTLVYGGLSFDTAGNTTGSFSDTWEWDGTSWTQDCASNTCSPVQANTFGVMMAFDGVRGHPILFGGQYCMDAACSLLANVAQTWEWNGSKWTTVCGLVGSPCTNVPPVRSRGAMVYDSKRKRTVLFGGLRNKVPLADTWEWDGMQWQQACTSATCSASVPAGRWAHSMAFDSTRGRTVLFGGCLDDACADHSTETWEWDGAAWLKTADTPTLVTAATQAMAFDASRGRMVLYENAGGLPYNPLTTWEYHVHGESCAKDTDCDTGHCVDGVCCETTCPLPCSVCNLPKSTGTCAPTPGCAGICDGNTTITDPKGNQFSCAPYKCTSSATCTATCTTTADCVPPAVCNSAGNCVPESSETSSGGGGGGGSGGGCATVPGDADVTLLPLAALAAAALRATYRRRPSRA